MYEMAGNRAGNAEPVLAFKANPRGNAAAQSIMVPENEQRLQDLLVEGQKQQGLREGMMPWYYMDPAYKRLEELVGPEEAKKQFHQLNTSMGTMSPNSTVNAEIARGTSAHYMANQGRFSDFDKYGGNPRQAPPDVAKMLEGMPGHKVHSTSQIGPLRKFMETGEHGMQSPKAPLYIQSSSVPELGFQTKLPVPDAHYTRLLGLPDVRGGTRDLGASMVMPEYQSTGDWFRTKVAEPVGMEAVPAQALMWGAGSGASGVKTAVGSPKLEMLADHIMSVAKRNKIAPELARDLVLQCKIRKRGGKVDAALRLADQRLASANGGRMSPTAQTLGIRVNDNQSMQSHSQPQDDFAGQYLQQQALIFEKFRQGGDESHRPQGTWLGLPISRQIVEGLRGTIAAENRRDADGRISGARFAVRLPAGVRQQAVELTVKGVCADCGPVHGKSRGHGRHQH
jgi:hypothetical protein